MSIFLLILISALWGSTFIFSKILLQEFSVSFLVTIRFLISLLIFSVIFKNKIKFNKTVVRNGLIIGTINGIALIIQIIGLQYTTASNSAFLTATYILFLPFLEYFFNKIPIEKKIISSILIALIGVYLLSFSNLMSFSPNKGDLITIGCGVLYAFQIFFISHFTKDENIITLVFLQFLVSSIVSFLSFLTEIILNLGKGNNFIALTQYDTLSAILFLSIFATFVPFTIQFYVQKKTSPTTAGICYLTEPIFALILAAIFLKEKLKIHNYLGIILILISVFIVSLKDFNILKKEK